MARLTQARCAALAVLSLLLVLSACGRRGNPVPPGPPDQLTYPKVYPSQ